MTRRARRVLGALVLAYLPAFAYVVVVTTPAYAMLPPWWVFVPPAVVSAFGLALLLGERAVRLTAWAVLVVVGLWLTDNVTAIIGNLERWAIRLGDAEDAFLSALRQSVSYLWHWLAGLVPALAAAAALRLFRKRRSQGE